MEISKTGGQFRHCDHANSQVRAIDVEGKGTGTTPDEIVAAMQYLFSEGASKINGARLPLY
ncbi:MAG TPA: hypothetical protein VHP14_07175 [Anaerolineales bacterium]|nr:hypothetical protein [Anaerolineales bacterium]